MKSGATQAQIKDVTDEVIKCGFEPLAVPGPTRTAICVTKNDGNTDESVFLKLSGVKEVIRVTKTYKLVSREVQPIDTVVDIDGVKLGGDNPVLMMSGPCSVEEESSTLKVAEAVKSLGLTVFRAGAFKPRTSPYSFQGFGDKGLRILEKVKKEFGLKVVTEIMDTETVDEVADCVDMLQIGTRNMQNFSLLKKVGQLRKPVLLKRGMSSTLDEWLNAAEYLLQAGNNQVALCERGIRTFSKHCRNTLDLNVVPYAKALTHLPIVVDPSHGVGRRELVRPMSRAAVACGAQGLLIESHVTPNQALSDQAQTIDMDILAGIQKDLDVLKNLETI